MPSFLWLDLPEENFPEVVLLAVLSVRKCQGSRREFLSDFFACRHCKYEGPKIKRIVPTLGQHLFYLTMLCVQKHNKEKDMTIKDVTMATDTFTLLMPDHLCFLHQKGLLETIAAKLK